MDKPPAGPLKWVKTSVGFLPFVMALIVGPLGLWFGMYAVVILASLLSMLVLGRPYGGFMRLPLFLWLFAELVWAADLWVRSLLPHA